MRVSTLLALAFFWLSPVLYHSASAQTPTWQVLRGNSGAPFGRVAGSGNIALLSLACSQGKPIMLMTLRRAPLSSPAQLTLSVGGQNAQIAIQRTANPAVWGTLFNDGRVLNMVAAGQQASFAINGSAFGGVPLGGAGAAMREALAGCWQEAARPEAVHPTQGLAADTTSTVFVTPVDLKGLRPADRTAIMRAAGYTLKGRSWLTCEGQAPGEIKEIRDLNGDGKAEAIVTSEGTACYGMTGTAFQIVTPIAGGWRLVAAETGIPSFHSRSGIAWPDIEVGGPGSRCFLFKRWSRDAYVDGGTSQGGRICNLSPAAAARASAPPVAPVGNSNLNNSDDEAIRAIIGRIYGWRDGRRVAEAHADDWMHLFTPRVRALHAQCEAAVANADPKANGGEGAYMVTGDQGCLGVPFLLDAVTLDPAPFVSRSRPALRRTGPDTIESTIAVPTAARAEWGTSETIRFQRINQRWLIDEVVTVRPQGPSLYSSSVAGLITELRKIARRPAARRQR